MLFVEAIVWRLWKRRFNCFGYYVVRFIGCIFIGGNRYEWINVIYTNLHNRQNECTCCKWAYVVRLDYCCYVCSCWTYPWWKMMQAVSNIVMDWNFFEAPLPPSETFCVMSNESLEVTTTHEDQFFKISSACSGVNWAWIDQMF